MDRLLMSKNGPAVAGLVLGVIAAFLVKFGNPGNMGFCVACFTRDIAGAFGLHRAAIVQYLRPEIAGFILGAFGSALAFSEYRPRGGSSPMVRFALGFFAMIGALVFLGCPWRAYLRLAGGDWNAIAGIAGLIVGIGIGANVLHQGGDLAAVYQLVSLKIAATRSTYLHIGYSLQNFRDPNFLMLGIGYRFNNRTPRLR